MMDGDANSKPIRIERFGLATGTFFGEAGINATLNAQHSTLKVEVK
jgi:hypothetical protein